MILNRTRIVVHDCARRKTLICYHQQSNQQQGPHTGHTHTDGLSVADELGSGRPYQSHAAQHRQAVDNFQSEVDQRCQHDNKVKHIPTVTEEVHAERSQLQDAFGRENRSENLERPEKKTNRLISLRPKANIENRTTSGHRQRRLL